MGHTSRSGDGSGAMGHASPSNCHKILPNSFRNTMGHKSRPNILRIPTGRNNRNSSMGYMTMNSSKDCNIRSNMGCSVCSNTMNCLCCMVRNNIHNCFRGPISSRTDFLRQSRQYLRPSGHTGSLPRSFLESLWCPSCLRKDISETPWSWPRGRLYLILRRLFLPCF